MELMGSSISVANVLCNEMLWGQSVLCDETLIYFVFMLYVMKH